jgi:conserved oligomeric Golgi complex subunit 3
MSEVSPNNAPPKSNVAAAVSAAETELDLLKLSVDIDDELLEASLGKYQAYLEQLDAACSHLAQLLASTTETLNELSEISATFQSIDSQTKAFQKQTASVVEEQAQNEKNAEAIAENLQYYEPLERITRRLNAPGAGNMARSQDFSDMLRTLDECIDYMQTHPEHKEAESYRSRYRLLLTRALTLVRNAFMSNVREITTEVASRIAAKQLNHTTHSALLYAKFRVGAADMKELGLEIQKRANPPADAQPGEEGEYQSLMNELHQSFAACRARLLLPLIQKQLAETAQAPASKDLVQFARSAISYIRGICLDEFELWQEWFHGQRGLYDLLESLCEPLYDYLRPRIVHESRLSKLCALVSLLQTRYIQDEEDDNPLDLNKLDFGILVQQVMEDTQTRLLFRAQAILRNEIENYKPTAQDLDYPSQTSRPPTSASTRAPLSGKRGKTPRSDSVEFDSDDETSAIPFSFSSADISAVQHSYPTLSRALSLLSRIYRLVNSSIFDDLAHQIVHSTTLSLMHASTLITTKASPADGQLFLLKHLLLLKSQIVAFDIEFVTPDITFDFSNISSTFYELQRERGGLFNPANWIRLVTSGGLLPRVVENMLDAKQELDGQLRNVINDFTAGFATLMTESLPSIDANGALSKAKTKDAEPPEQSAAQTRQKIEQETPILRAKLEQYLADPRTRETLVAAVEDQVVQIYEAFFEAYTVERKKNVANGGISRKGKSPEEMVWDSDTFTEWCEGVFNVALPHRSDDDEEDRGSVKSVSMRGSGSS